MSKSIALSVNINIFQTGHSRFRIPIYKNINVRGSRLVLTLRLEDLNPERQPTFLKILRPPISWIETYEYSPSKYGNPGPWVEHTAGPQRGSVAHLLALMAGDYQEEDMRAYPIYIDQPHQ